MDCLCWVNRDSYLPQGSRGLKVSDCFPVICFPVISCVGRAASPVQLPEFSSIEQGRTTYRLRYQQNTCRRHRLVCL